MSGKPLSIAPALLADIYAHAQECFPAECCGWIRGPREENELTAVRRCNNAQATSESGIAGRGAETAYVIEGKDLLEFTSTYEDGDEPPKILYHSHPNGRAYFSDTDQGVAAPFGEPSYWVQHLVVGLTADKLVEAALFDWGEAEEKYIEVARWLINR